MMKKRGLDWFGLFMKSWMMGCRRTPYLYTLHIHAIVENQLAMGVELVPETIKKLIRQGLYRHEAIHAIGAIVAEDMFNLMKGNIKEFSLQRYRRRLEKITAKRWRRGQY